MLCDINMQPKIYWMKNVEDENKCKETQDPVKCQPSVSLPNSQEDCIPKIYSFLVPYILSASTANCSILNYITSAALPCVV